MRRLMDRDQEMAAVRELGDVIGYGNLMHIASELWLRQVGGGAFSVGTCYDLLKYPEDVTQAANYAAAFRKAIESGVPIWVPS